MLPKIELIYAFMAMVSATLAQGVINKIAPEGPIPSGCQLTALGEFEITIVKVRGDFKKQKQLAVEVCLLSYCLDVPCVGAVSGCA